MSECIVTDRATMRCGKNAVALGVWAAQAALQTIGTWVHQRHLHIFSTRAEEPSERFPLSFIA